MNIYVGNLSGETMPDDLRKAFGAFGEVASAIIIKDKVSGESRGYGFVKMSLQEEGRAAVSGLHGQILQGNMLKVDEARARTDNDNR